MKSKLTSWTLISKTTEMLKSIINNWKMIGIYSVLLAFVFMATGHLEYGCESSLENYWCFAYNGSPLTLNILYLIMIVCVGYLLFSFMYDFYNTSFKGDAFKASNILKLSKDKLKMFGRLIGLIFALIVLIGGAAYIIMREPDPNWEVEFIYFTVAFTALALLVLGLRLSAALCGIVEGDIYGKIKKIYHQTENRSFSIVLVFLCLILCENLLYLKIHDHLQTLVSTYNFFIVAIVSGVISGILICVFTAAIVIFVRAQYEILLSQIDSQIAVAENEVKNQDRKEVETTRKKLQGTKRKNSKKRTKK